MSMVDLIVVYPEWDTYQEEDGSYPTAESLGLPDYVALEVLSDQSPEDRDIEITDKLSDKYGYCVLSYT